MSKVYTIRQALLHADLIDSVDGYEVYCDGYAHYLVTPLGVDIDVSCCCREPKARRVALTTVARHRYEVYNKDPDFFWDHESGTLFWLQISSGRERDWSLSQTDILVRQIIDALNREDIAEAIRIRKMSGKICQDTTTV